jgi:hypothetical protein
MNRPYHGLTPLGWVALFYFLVGLLIIGIAIPEVCL